MANQTVFFTNKKKPLHRPPGEAGEVGSALMCGALGAPWVCGGFWIGQLVLLSSLLLLDYDYYYNTIIITILIVFIIITIIILFFKNAFLSFFFLILFLLFITFSGLSKL